MAATTSQSRAAEFKEALHSRILVADGAMGTALYSKGVFLNRCYDELNLSLPALIRDVHQDYVRAGAEIIETNTFGANRKRLAAFGFAEKMRQINQAGVRIAREAASDLAFVAGAVGPLGVRLEPLGSTTFAEARALFREQFAALAEAGVDLLILETFRDLDELREAILAAREAAGDEIAIVAQVTIEDDGQPTGRQLDGNVHASARSMAGRRDRIELLFGTTRDARNDREHAGFHQQAAERDAQRRAAR